MRRGGDTYDEGAQHAHGSGALDVGAVQRARHVTGVGHVDGIASDLCDMTRRIEGPGELSGRGEGGRRARGEGGLSGLSWVGGWVGRERGTFARRLSLAMGWCTRLAGESDEALV